MNKPAGRTLRLALLLWVSSGAAAVMALLTQIWMVRELAPSDFGEIAALVTTYTIGGTLGHMGLGNMLVRLSAEAPTQNDAWARAALRLALALSAMAVLVVVGFALFRGDRLGLLACLLMPVALSYTFSELTIARYQVQERLGAVAAQQLTPNALRLLCVFIVTAIVPFGEATEATAAALGLASLIAGALAVFRFARSLAPVSESESTVSSGQMLGRTWPYGLSGAVYLAYSQGGVLLLRWLDGPAAAGKFALCVGILSAVYLLPFAVFQRLAAKRVAVWSTEGSARLAPYIVRASLASAIVGLVVAVALALAAGHIVALLFGTKYRVAGELLSILAFAIPFRFVSTAAGTTLSSHSETRMRLAVQIIMLALFFGGATVASGFGLMSVANLVCVAFVVSEAAMAIAYVVIALRRANRVNTP